MERSGVHWKAGPPAIHAPLFHAARPGCYGWMGSQDGGVGGTVGKGIANAPYRCRQTSPWTRGTGIGWSSATGDFHWSSGFVVLAHCLSVAIFDIFMGHP